MEKDEKSATSSLISGFLFGAAVWAALSVVLILLCAAVSYMNPDPEKLMAPLGIASLYIALAVGGITAAVRGGTLLSSAAVGAAALAVLLIASALKPDGLATHGASIQALLYCLTVPAALIGGCAAIIAARKRASSPHRKRRRKR